MMTFGSAFKFSAYEPDFDGKLFEEFYTVHATGFTEAQEFLKKILGHNDFKFLGEIQ